MQMVPLTKLVTVGPGLVPVQLLGSDSNRRLVEFRDTGLVSGSNICPGANFDPTFVMFSLSNTTILHFDYDKWGPYVTGEWWCLTAGGVGKIAVYCWHWA